MAIMNWEMPTMTPAQIHDLVTQIAEELGPGWTVGDDRHRNLGRLELHGPDRIELCIQVGPTRVAVRGIHGNVGANAPYLYGCTEPIIRFSVTKTPRRMAGEITRRLLPAVRQDAAILAAARAERDARLAGRLDTLLKARELLGGDLSWAEHDLRGRPTELDYACTRHRSGDSPLLIIELQDYEGGDHRDQVRLSNLTHEQVLIIAEAAARIIADDRAA